MNIIFSNGKRGERDFPLIVYIEERSHLLSFFVGLSLMIDQVFHCPRGFISLHEMIIGHLLLLLLLQFALKGIFYSWRDE
jgi:hypothetical protein